MKNASNRHEYGELDLAQILRELFRWKWSILGATLLVGLAAAVYSLTRPNVYASSAALIVREPQQVIDRESEELRESAMLSVETLQTLSESTEISRALFERLCEKGAIPTDDGTGRGRQALFMNFQKTLDTELKHQQTRRSGSSDLLPILMLKARAKSPEQAQIVANEWAAIIVAESSKLYTQGVEALDAFVGDMYTQSNQSLAKLENALASKELEASLTLKEARLKTLSTKITQLEDAILEIDIELAVNEVAIADGRKRIEELQVGGEWLGAVVEEALLRSEPYPFAEEELTAHARKVLEWTEQKVRQEEELRKLRMEENLLSKEKRFEHCQLDILRILEEKAKVDDELPALEAAIATLTAQLETIPEKVTLNKAITDDALWNLYVVDSEAASKMAAPLKTEMLNPVYENTHETIVKLVSDAEKLRGSASQLEVSEKAATARAQELEREISLITQELDRRQSALDASVAFLKFIRDDHLLELTTVQELALKNERRDAERKTRKAMLATLKAEATGVEKDISDFEVQIASLTREADKTRNVREMLASKAEEVALLQVSSENATRTGTTILYEAGANPIKVAPARSKIVLSAMAVALLLCSVLVSAASLLREPD